MSNQVRKVSSLDSTSSVSSTSSQRLSGGNTKDPNHEYATTAAVTTSYSRHLSDICAILIHCPKHDRFALVNCSAHRGLWFPYVSLKQSEGWYAAIVNKIRQLLDVRIGVKSASVFTPPEIMHVMRIQLPEVLKYVTRVVFMTNLQSVPSVSSPSSANSSAIRSMTSIERETSLKNALANKTGSGGAQQKNVVITSNNVFRCYCESSEPVNGMRWFKHETIVTEEESLEIWGPEPGMFTSAFATNSVEKGAYSEYTLREAIRFQPREPPRTYQEEMLKSCHFERGDILRLYSDYVQHCFPSQNMNYVSFCDYLLKLGYDPAESTGSQGPGGSGSGSKIMAASSSITAAASQHSSSANYAKLNLHDMRSLYRAFKFNRHMPYVTFHELLLGLAAMDRSTAHGGHSGELRASYIFRYYDSNQDGYLGPGELRHMAQDRLRTAQLKQVHSALKSAVQSSTAGAAAVKAAIGKHPNVGGGGKSASGSVSSKSISEALSKGIDADSVQKELAKIYQMLNLKPGDSISELNFMMAVGSMQLRGTSALFRSQISVLPVRQHYETIAEKHALTDIEGNLVGGELKRKGTCPRCKDKHYSLALHTVKLTHDAQIVEPTEVRFDEYPPPISRAARQLSRITFASDSTPNRLIDMITTYWNAVAAQQAAQQGGSNQGSGSMSLRMLTGSANAVNLGKTSWERIDRKVLAEEIKRVCAQAEQIFKQEARVVPVTSPCFVLGDIHGNLNDLRIYERILWPTAPTSVVGSYLFLGDYVDRGDYGLECICYLLSMKVLAPKTFYLLRGNHELRSIQQAFTFFREVCEKFRNQQLGVHVWDTLNKCFDVMPVAATIDDQIFCSHGGIPTSALRLDELYNIPTPMPDPENQSAAAWEILWNDPVSSTEYSEYADLLRKQPGGQQAVANMQGYLPNTKRGTAFFFSEEAVKRFLHLNNLSHIIRAHECVPPGYALHCNGKVITIFSSSHYCGATNDAACILVEREKLRIIRLDTD
uniref:Serine/threonine-protein phosphatase n=1 Tax=Aceria tosichella TaxID=561515 RepID=A0A6G1S6C2_9ACAR